MSAIEFALKPQSCIDGLSLVPSEKPSTEAFIARYEKLTNTIGTGSNQRADESVGRNHWFPRWGREA